MARELITTFPKVGFKKAGEVCVIDDKEIVIRQGDKEHRGPLATAEITKQLGQWYIQLGGKRHFVTSKPQNEQALEALRQRVQSGGIVSPALQIKWTGGGIFVGDGRLVIKYRKSGTVDKDLRHVVAAGEGASFVLKFTDGTDQIKFWLPNHQQTFKEMIKYINETDKELTEDEAKRRAARALAEGSVPAGSFTYVAPEVEEPPVRCRYCDTNNDARAGRCRHCNAPLA